MHSNVVDRTGQVFGRLTVMCQAESKRSETNKGNHARWRCRCECGSTVVVDVGNLRSGRTKSCGCLRRESVLAISAANIVHAHAVVGARSRTYRSWEAMKYRCNNPHHKYWRLYGGRGIRVCERWQNSFANFLADMGERPKGKTLDRYQNQDGNYEIDNCRWATPKEQQDNRRDRKIFTRSAMECAR